MQSNTKEQNVYLGCILTADGSASSELNRRLGGAREEFEKLRRVWAHAGISRARKLEIFNTCVVSRLLYNLHSLWSSTAEIRKIDAFQCKCLRRVLKIPPSYYSHVSNALVLKQADAKRMSCLLLEKQLKWWGTLARRNTDDLLRRSVFDPDRSDFEPRGPCGPKRRGRPKVSWAKGVSEHIVKVGGSRNRLITLLGQAPKSAWEKAVCEYCHNGDLDFPY